jgi:DNA-binding NtrC family response regulator
MDPKQTVLIIDDEEAICWGLQQVAKGLQLDARVASSAEDGLELEFSTAPDLIIMDIRLPGMDGLTAMAKFRDRWNAVPIVIITAFGDLETAVSAVRKGAFEYVVKPFDSKKIQNVIGRALRQLPTAEGDVVAPVAGFVAASPQMQRVFNEIALAANSDANVLLLGESGTGKELAAQALHQFSRRSSFPYVVIHLAALSPELIESELFGHLRGAFTGADRNRNGLLTQANGGTVLLDEVGEIPLPVQVKLLRVLEQKQLYPVGSNAPVPSDFRVLAATHRDLKQLVAEGKFRQDLYFRLAAFSIHLPPLRERKDDILPLVQYFLSRIFTAPSQLPALSAEAQKLLVALPWLGNVRELRNAIEHAAIVSRGQTILPEHLPQPAQFGMHEMPVASSNSCNDLSRNVRDWAELQLQQPRLSMPLHELLLQEIEPALFQEVLKATQGNVSLSAQILGIHRTTLRRKMDQYAIEYDQPFFPERE